MNSKRILLFKAIYIFHLVLLIILSAGRFLTNSIFQQQLYIFIIYYCLMVISVFLIIDPSISYPTRKSDNKELFYTRIWAVTLVLLSIIRLIELSMLR
ncbi:hypothetical protein KQI86_15990 [Clostridium sp. MSJ-11]|uniref:Uncharacterized protein n=1 Tax=Clostridium mobile TaxID=2841512 RepID=A0ABS6EKU2_9CLOT|nr:hypothetical protein [Clostridium mobile]MBU5485821.1 hypothetical protein [Clostridium mobile]